ncbi:thiamine ABC transporter substrate-binding protein [Treponema phagedenis]|uniref:ABC transporter, substrate-binding protein, thiB family n=1 Tax=Treponema phagedenis TaxID=162 RepID=A0A0B7GV61_TREPH|nr:thiamine ABC transporter substrate-binding protein [Treponema phagedenis]EFW37378.1 ABC transporter, substrate-binding protein, thiB family [Treponema phagedenis F0421]NVP25135.1 thiamine ABC transporter substrate-binding protein [Treponema phagedenis]QEJ97249.1 thiamine ABC transporter substrate-binding protein [Treponema phagedenis]QEK02558.1 thiamine ABC transporter substrate-binding protein [Treponema phagedenis]QEK08186.1 thiamine ABC transporter substrate-binding protein [Treponema ph
MKKLYVSILSLLFSVLLILPAFAGGSIETGSKTVTVYAYDSFTAEWGAGPEIAKRFKAKTGYTVKYVTLKDSGDVLARAILEKDNPKADVLIGIDNYLASKARAADILEPYHPNVSDTVIPKEYVFEEDWLLSPYDYGFFSIMYDTKAKVSAPNSLSDLTRPEYEKTLVIMDPRTSTPGLGFAVWTKAAFGESYLTFWEQLKSSIITMTPGWSAGYSLFTSGEAAMATSYTTSMAYHVAADKTDRFKALIFPEGHIMQIEGLGLVKGAANPQGAKAFIDFMLSKEAQEVLPETQWMFPCSQEVQLPESFKAIPLPKKALTLSAKEAEEIVQPIIEILTR